MTAAVDRHRLAARAAVVAATVMIAQQIAGKATRDALFLDQFPVSALPPIVIASSVASILTAVLLAGVLTRRGPAAILPATFGVSALLFFGELAAYPAAPATVAVVLYLHMSVLGGIVASTFWALVNERFDPHTAKRRMNQIVAGATLGGLVGGLIAERVAATAGLLPMLPILGVMHAFCAWRVLALRTPDVADSASASDDVRSGFEHLAGMPYLRNLALLLLLTTVAGGFIDYVFKAEAAAWFNADGDEMLRFFAIFYTGASLLAFLAQTLLARRALERLGLVRTAVALPLAILGAGAAALAVPGLVTVTALRGAQDVTRNSFFRSAYELLYNPLPRAAKRATKLLIDVGVDRMGDAAGAGIVAATLLAGPATAHLLLIAGAMAFAGCAVALGVVLHRGYVRALERSLVTQADALDLADLRDSTTRLTVLETLGTLDVPEALRRRAAHPDTAPAAGTSPPAPPVDDPVIAAVMALRSGDRARIDAALGRRDLHPSTAPHLIALLAWDDVKEGAIAALRGLAPRITGQLADALLDPEQPFAVRRRVPRALRAGDPPRARDALLAALHDPRFEVRFQCARALHAVLRDAPATSGGPLLVEKRDIYPIVARELDVGERVWSSHRLLDSADAAEAPLLDEVLAERADRGLEHVFNLLALVLPRRPVRVAFHGLMTDDDALRGTALEYLDSALPEALRDGVRRVAQAREEREAGDRVERTPEDAAARLLDSMPSIELRLQDLLVRVRAAAPADGAPPEPELPPELKEDAL